MTLVPGIKDARMIRNGMSKGERMVKRFIDITLAMIATIIFSPLIVICYVLAWRDFRGKAIFTQERIGMHGKPFLIYKFRSMDVNTESDGPHLCGKKNDRRMTRTGRFLREHHLDELPQLLNVIRGDMALVGPRPERKFFIDQIMQHDPRYTFLYQIRPGVTSYATLYNGYTDTMEKMLRRLEMDLYYLEHGSLILDARILIKTFTSIILGKKF